MWAITCAITLQVIITSTTTALARLADRYLRAFVKRPPASKKDELKFFKCLVEKARMFDELHLCRVAMLKSRTPAGSKKPDGGDRREGGKAFPKKSAAVDGKPSDKPSADAATPAKKLGRVRKEPPRDGCWHCGKAHWLDDQDSA